MGTILCFDITNYNSFKELDMWMDCIREYGQLNMQLMLIGNKSDESDMRQVSAEEIKSYANKIGAAYIEVSSKTDKNIHNIFINLANQIHQNYKCHIKPVYIKQKTKKRWCCLG